MAFKSPNPERVEYQTLMKTLQPLSGLGEFGYCPQGSSLLPPPLRSGTACRNLGLNASNPDGIGKTAQLVGHSTENSEELFRNGAKPNIFRHFEFTMFCGCLIEERGANKPSRKSTCRDWVSGLACSCDCGFQSAG